MRRSWLLWLALIILGLLLPLLLQATRTSDTSPVLGNTAFQYAREPVLYNLYIPNVSHARVDTPLRTARKIPVEALASWLGASPLAPHADDILASDYWSTIIGICTIEQYHCQKAPNWNFWGLGGSRLLSFSSAEEGIEAIDSFLKKIEPKHPTIESLNGYYVQPASEVWLSVVLETKREIEKLN